MSEADSGAEAELERPRSISDSAQGRNVGSWGSPRQPEERLGERILSGYASAKLP